MGMTMEQLEEKFIPVWKHIEDFVPMDSEKETQKFGKRLKIAAGSKETQNCSKKQKVAQTAEEESTEVDKEGV